MSQNKKLRLAYVMSYRNATADKSGQNIEYKGGERYMTSPLAFLVEALGGKLGEKYELVGVIHDDDPNSEKDMQALGEYGFFPSSEKPWIFPKDLALPNSTKVTDITHSVPSSYRSLSKNDPERQAQKKEFEERLVGTLRGLEVDVVLVDGLLVILDASVDETSPYHRKILNVHPGITREGSPYQRRGAYATLDALYGAQGKKIIDWQTKETVEIPVVSKTGASLHYIDKSIDAGEVIYDVLETDISPDDTILEMRWNNFHKSLFPAIEKGLLAYAETK